MSGQCERNDASHMTGELGDCRILQEACLIVKWLIEEPED